jgi:hypothetical protein
MSLQYFNSETEEEATKQFLNWQYIKLLSSLYCVMKYLCENNYKKHDFFLLALQPIVGLYFAALYRAIASSRTRFLDHTQRRATVGRTPLDE